jgi:hypothetical protein
VKVGSSLGVVCRCSTQTRLIHCDIFHLRRIRDDVIFGEWGEEVPFESLFRKLLWPAEVYSDQEDRQRRSREFSLHHSSPCEMVLPFQQVLINFADGAGGGASDWVGFWIINNKNSSNLISVFCLRFLCVLCGSAVKDIKNPLPQRGGNAETQRSSQTTR